MGCQQLEGFLIPSLLPCEQRESSAEENKDTFIHTYKHTQMIMIQS